METIKTKIVGMKFRPGAHDHLLGTPDGTAVDLRREPDNPHDPNAIAAVVRGKPCGFVPRTDAETLAPMIDGGATVAATLTNYNDLTVEIGGDHA